MNAQLIEQFIKIVGSEYALTNEDDQTRYITENRGLFTGSTPLVVKPGNTDEVSQIVRLANETKTVIVPQGGHTGHVGGAMPDESGEQVILSLERMNRVREVDLNGNVIVCEAGCVLESIQSVADQHERLFPLALGSQGSCQIGGNISTNAGGTGVLAYGNTRQLVMGLEVVLPSGEIWNGLRRLKKDNTGYDLKDLFIGAEGTLGVVTAAVLKLFPKPVGKAMAFCGMETVDHAIRLLEIAQSAAGQGLTAFEFMAATPVTLTVQHMEGVRVPLQKTYPWYVMVEVSSGRSEEDAADTLQDLLEKALETEVIRDAAVATSISQQKDIWKLRESMPLAQWQIGGSMKHDISIPIHRIPQFLEKADRLVTGQIPGARLYTFGHLGDGNIHYNVSQPEGADKENFLAMQPQINDMVHELVEHFEGSVAAEHGVGQLKRDLVARTKDPVELELMQSLKRTLDPKGIMNPGKVIKAAD